MFRLSILVQGAALTGGVRRCVRCSRKRSRGACGLRPVPARRAACHEQPQHSVRAFD